MQLWAIYQETPISLESFFILFSFLAKLAKWLSCVVTTYLYGAFDCMFLSCHVRVSEWIYQMSFSHHQKSSNVFQSLSSLTMSRIFSSATAVAVHFGWNSSAFMFTLFSLTSLVVLFDSHCYYNGYKNCINEFLTSSLSNRPDHIAFMPFIIDLSCSFFESEITSSLTAQKKIWINVFHAASLH